MSVQTIFMGGLRWRQTLYTSMWGAQRHRCGCRRDSLRYGLPPSAIVGSRVHIWPAILGGTSAASAPLCRRKYREPHPGWHRKTPLTMWVARWYQQQGGVWPY